MKTLPRLVYLAAEVRESVPLSIRKLLPQGELIGLISEVGLEGAKLELGLGEAESLTALYQEGKRMVRSEASREEFKKLVATEILDQLELSREERKLSQYLKDIALVEGFANGTLRLIDDKEFSLSDDAGDRDQIAKWQSGFSPLDQVMGGLYQGILTLIGQPGGGKTSMMLSLMEALRVNNQASSIWFFQLEIPLDLLLWRSKKMRARTKFLPSDKFICGWRTIDEVLERIESDPDPNRVILFDSPDVLAAGMGGERRFAVEKIYQQLVQVKEKSKLIFTCSQPRRKDKHITIESVAEAWAKSWYSDGVLGLYKIPGPSPTRLKLSVVKNRFGIGDQEITFLYNYSDLTWQSLGEPGLPGEWDDNDW